MKFFAVESTERLKKIIDKLSVQEGKYICSAIFTDPFADLYPILLILYGFVLAGFLLWPFDFVSLVGNDVRWIENPKGIEFVKIGQAVSNSSNQEFFERLVRGKGLTLEVWLQTEDLNQSGPARILSYSRDTGLRNFTLGQSQKKLVVRLRTTETNFNGTKPHLVIEEAFNDQSPQHMVIIYDFSTQRVYVDGVKRVESRVLKGSFSNWDRSFSLAIGNEITGNRPWKGKIYYAAIYDRPLSEQEIRHNYVSGLQLKTNKEFRKQSGLKTKGPVARYLFNEGHGDVVHDSVFVSTPLNLYIPKYIKHKTAPFLNASIHSFKSKSQFSDIILNTLIFIPLGILIHGMLRNRYGLTLKISLVTLLAGILFTLGVESLQHFSMTRNSSLIDVSTNMTGIAIGIVIDRLYTLFLNYRAKRLQMLLYDWKE